MAIFNIIFFSVATYVFTFIYYFSFNENVLLVVFLAIFLYSVNCTLSSVIADTLDTGSFELYMTHKAQAASTIRYLESVRSKLLSIVDTKNNVLDTLTSFINFQLLVASFTEQFNELLYESMLYSNLTSLLLLQDSFMKSELGDLLTADFSISEFEE